MSNRSDCIKSVQGRKTIALSISTNSSSYHALVAVRDSNGPVTAVDDCEIIKAQKLLTKFEGTYAEPSSAASLAKVIESKKDGTLEKGYRTVCVIRPTGVKEAESAVAQFEVPRAVGSDRSSSVSVLNGSYGSDVASS